MDYEPATERSQPELAPLTCLPFGTPAEISALQNAFVRIGLENELSNMVADLLTILP
jgi:hypothetical protein